MVTKARDVIAAAIGGGDDPFALASFDLTTIDRDANRIRIGRRKIFLGLVSVVLMMLPPTTSPESGDACHTRLELVAEEGEAE